MRVAILPVRIEPDYCIFLGHPGWWPWALFGVGVLRRSVVRHRESPFRRLLGKPNFVSDLFYPIDFRRETTTVQNQRVEPPPEKNRRGLSTRIESSCCCVTPASSNLGITIRVKCVGSRSSRMRSATAGTKYSPRQHQTESLETITRSPAPCWMRRTSEAIRFSSGTRFPARNGRTPNTNLAWRCACGTRDRPWRSSDR